MNELFVAEGCQDRTPVGVPKTAKTRNIEMVVMIMGKQNPVDGREALKRNTRRIVAFGAGDAKRRAALGKAGFI